MGDLVRLPERPADLAGLEARRSELRSKRKAVEGAIATILVRSWETEQGDRDINAAAEAVIAGDEGGAPDGGFDRLRALQRRKEVLDRADRILSERIANLRERHNLNTAAALRPAHRKAVARIARALLELERANGEEEEVRGQARGAPLPPLTFPNVGRRGPESWPIQCWFDQAARLRYSTPGDLLAAE